MLNNNAVLQNRYKIIRQLGRGGMGAVYEAVDGRLNRTVALKETLVETDELRHAFEREAQLLANLRHPALPKVLDHFSEGEGLFLVMEFIPGPDLGVSLSSLEAGFPYEKVKRWAIQLLDALGYLHGHQPPIIHRDIKPANLKQMPDGHIILLDFGLAKGAAGQMVTLTSSRSILGYTPNYAPLEQAQGTSTDSRSDIYALGATLYHLATGVKPPDALARADAAVNGKRDPLKPATYLNSEIPQAFSSTLARAMALNRDMRPATADEMLEELRSDANFAFSNASAATGKSKDLGFDEEATRVSKSFNRNHDQVVIPVPQLPNTRPVKASGGKIPVWIPALILLLLFGCSLLLVKYKLFSFGKGSSPIQSSQRQKSIPTQGASPVASNTVNGPKTSPESRDAMAKLAQKKIPFKESNFVHAVQDGDVDTVEAFLKAGMSANIQGPGKATPLILAGFNGHRHISQLLLNKGAEVNAKDENGLTALMGAASHDHQGTLGVLLEAGADLDAANNNGETALLLAAKEGNREIVRMLLDKGARVDPADKYGRTAVTWASINDHPETVQLLKVAAGN